MFGKIFCLIIFAIVFQKGNCQQNLVLNPGFESFDSCLSILGNFGVVNNWHHPLTYSTPDYFNSCNTTPLSTGVPGNLFGFQQPHTGQAYAGIMTSYFHPLTLLRNYREYIGGQLSSPLVAGNKYCIKFYVSAGDSCLYVSDNLGIYLTALQVQDTLWMSNPIIPLQYTPQIENTIFNLGDRINWTEVSWEYIATGGELFFALGNFRDTLATTTTSTGWVNPFSPNYISYLYIDDVSIVQCDSITSVHSLENIAGNPADTYTLYPNPATLVFTINGPLGNLKKVELYSMDGKLITLFKQPLPNEYSVTGITNGIYQVKLTENSGHVCILKLSIDR